MNPLSALVGGVSSLLGGFMNTSSAQAINSANLQYAMEQASGAFLPSYYKNLVSGASAAGINPLAALGVSSPGFSYQAQPTNPGEGLMAAAKGLFQVDPHEEKLKALTEEKASVEIANARLAGNNAAQQIARDSMINQAMETYLRSHPDARPEGIGEPTVAGQGVDSLNHLNEAIQSFGKRFGDWSGRIYNPGTP